MPNDYAGNTLGTARDLNITGSPQIFTDYVDSLDTNDYYRFTFNSRSSLNLSVNGLSGDADVQLLNSSGQSLQSSARGGTNPESINTTLDAGTYYIRVYPYGGASTNYNLSVSTTSPSNLVVPEIEVGTLSSTQSFYDTVSSTDTADTYHFNLSNTSNFNLSLTGLSNDADVRLIRDANNNGFIDSGEEITRSSRGGSLDESINFSSLSAGSYFAQVYQFSGDTNYTLRLSTQNPSDLLATETNIGTLSGTRTFSDSVNSTDTSDIYRFSLGASSNFNLTLTGLSNDADVRLIRDANNNGIFDAGEEMARSSYTGTGSEWISQSSLAAGNYFVQVYQYSGDTNYNLSVSTGDWYSQNLHDAGIIGQARTFAADGQLSRNDMIAILRDTEDYSVIDSTEVTDLRTLVSGRSSLMPDYVRVLSNDIVNGSVANTSSGIGNLYAGSSSTQMERLIGKWFLGNDHPTASGTYQYVSGSLFQNGISYQDVSQGSANDCYFVASLAETAFRSPSTISSMFIDNGDNTYTVRFFNNGVADYVTVDRYLPTNGGNAIYAGWGSGSNTSSTNELWVALAEKAYAQINQSGWIGQDNTNSYQGIDFGWPRDAMSQIAGRNTTQQSINVNNIVSAFSAGRMVALNTNVSGVASNLVNNHSYSLVGYNSSTDRFTLYNPWGFTVEVSRNDIINNFRNWDSTTT